MNILPVILIVGGIAAFVYGVLIFFDVIKTNTSEDSEFDKKHLSEKTRYFIGRYYAGIQGILGGLGLILLAVILYFSEI